MVNTKSNFSRSMDDVGEHVKELGVTKRYKKQAGDLIHQILLRPKWCVGELSVTMDVVCSCKFLHRNLTTGLKLSTHNQNISRK